MNNNLIISGLHLDLSPALKNIVNEKMEKIFKHEEKIIRARVELVHDSKSSSHENEYTAKGHLELKGATITISSSSDNIYKSIVSPSNSYFLVQKSRFQTPPWVRQLVATVKNIVVCPNNSNCCKCIVFGFTLWGFDF